MVEWGGRLGVAKEYFHQPWWFRCFVAPLLHSREAYVLLRLAGCKGVPAVLGFPIRGRAVVEYIPGVPVEELESERMSVAVLAQIESILDEIHSRGVAHCDLGHDHSGDIGRETNLRVDAEGQVYVLDFTGALAGPPPLPGGKQLFELMAKHDRLVLTKLANKFFPRREVKSYHRIPDTIPPWGWRLLRWLKKV